jgi:antitoxin component of MazEF toxin-antitoxin module
MRTSVLKVARIGNSRGVRLPAVTLRRYSVGATVVMEERADGIFLRPAVAARGKLSWGETAREMARSGEDWHEWDATASDGLASLPWERNRSAVAERATSFGKGMGGKHKGRAGKDAP